MRIQTVAPAIDARALCSDQYEMRKRLKSYGYRKFNTLPFKSRERLRSAGRMDVKFVAALVGLAVAVTMTLRFFA